MTRLRIGYTGLTHGYIMINVNNTISDICNTIQTVEHIPKDCTIYVRLRQDTIDIKAILKADATITTNVITYLKEVNLLNKI